MPERTFRHRLALVIATKDRPAELERLLASVGRQACQPVQIVVVEGGDGDANGVVERFAAALYGEVDHVSVGWPSLTVQKNAGIRALRPEITLVGFLDDDIVLEDGAIEAMLRYWERAADDVGGGGFNIIDTHPPRATWLKALFLIDGREGGKVLPSGYNTAIPRVTGTTEVGWLRGGATVWRREVVEAFQFDEWFEGYGYLEDVDYSYNVSRKYRLAVVADALVRHLSPPILTERNYGFGKWQVSNRMYFVRKYPTLSVARCYWACIGQTLVNWVQGLRSRDRRYILRALGNMNGLVRALWRRPDRMRIYLK